MTAATTGAGGRVARSGTLPRLANPGGANAIVDVARVAIIVILVALTLTGLAVTGDLLAGPIPEVGPQPGF